MGKLTIICEIGVNHNGDEKLARQMIDKAAECGADIVKFQTFKAHELVSISAPKAEYQTRNTGAGESQLEMLRKLELSDEAHRALAKYAETKNLEFLSTPFTLSAVERLVEFGVKRLKIPSGELINGPLLLAAARTGLPVILSTGMGNLDEIETALGALAFGYTVATDETPTLTGFSDALKTEEGAEAVRKNVTVLHCTTQYPAPLKDINLKAMNTIADTFDVDVGYSDHSEGIVVSLAAAARGAVMIEKHFTLDKSLPGPDHQASLEPDEFAAMVKGIREIEMALGMPEKTPSLSEMPNMAIARQSLIAANDIAAGDEFTLQNLTTKRPGNGISPMKFWDMLGQKAARAYAKDELID